jgi:DNA repair exonuclease SbcCD ATPase subunit
MTTEETIKELRKMATDAIKEMPSEKQEINEHLENCIRRVNDGWHHEVEWYGGILEEIRMDSMSHNEWHTEGAGGHECYVCGTPISPSDHHDNGACVSCVEDPDSGFDRG